MTESLVREKWLNTPHLHEMTSINGYMSKCLSRASHKPSPNKIVMWGQHVRKSTSALKICLEDTYMNVDGFSNQMHVPWLVIITHEAYTKKNKNIYS